MAVESEVVGEDDVEQIIFEGKDATKKVDIDDEEKIVYKGSGATKKDVGDDENIFYTGLF